MKFSDHVLAGLGFLLFAAFLQAGERRATASFHGVTPGTTTKAQLLAQSRWGSPLSHLDVSGASPEEFVYAIKPWEKIIVTIKDDVVLAVDLFPPERHNQIGNIAPSMGFGPPVPLTSVPQAAKAGVSPQPNWILLAPQDVCAFFWVTEMNGEQRVQMIRLYHPGSGETLDSAKSPSALPAPPPPPVPDAERRGTGGPGKADNIAGTSDANHRQIAKTVVQLIGQQHVSGHPLDDEIARRTTECLLSRFDGGKLYFMQSDVDRFRRVGTTLADQLRQGDISLGQDVLDTCVERMRERLKLLEELLEMDHDFTVDETWITAGDSREYAMSDLDVRETWCKLAKYNLLVHRTAGADTVEARRRTLRMFRDSLGQIEQHGSEDATNALLDSLLASFDPHSVYLPPSEATDQEILLRQELSGIGMRFRIENGYPTVQNLIPNGPAARGGQLKPEDRILAVGEGDDGQLVDVVGASLPDVARRMRGERGTVVRLQVLPAGQFESSVYRITRDQVETTNLPGAVLSGTTLPESRNAKVGYVYMPTFYVDRKAKAEGRDDYRSSTRDLERLLKSFAEQTVDAVLVDVRENEGGTLLEAIDTVGLFIDKGPVVQVKDRSGKVEVYAPQATSVAWRGPLVVLTSKQSAGGSEIFAGAVADYRRGLIVGDPHTVGMGTSQSLIALGPMLFQIPNPPQLGTAKLTVQKFYRPSGESTQLRGVVPHVVLPSLKSAMKIGEELRPYALGYDTIGEAAFTPLDSPIGAEMQQMLNTRSESRRRNSVYFEQLATRIEQAKAKWERTHVSLREADFLIERGQEAPEEDWPTVPGIAEVKLDPYLTEALLISLDYASRTRYAKAEKLYADRQFSSAVEDYRRAVLADPEFANGHYMLAWSLATCPEAAVRDGKAATQHAELACKLAGEPQWHYLLCLAVAEAEAGNFDSALDHLNSALDAAPNEQRTSYEYLVDRFKSRQPYQ